MKDKGSLLIVVGQPKKGEPPPPLKPMLPKGGDPGAQPRQESVTDDGGSPDGDAGFWNQDAPHVCETCGHFDDDKCAKGVCEDYETNDAALSGCKHWTGEKEEEGEEEEE